MALAMHKIQVWSGEVSDRPGEAAAILAKLAQAGADLEFVFTRAHPSKPGTQVISLAPVQGPELTEAAQQAGLAPARDIAMLCVEGANRGGIGSELMSRLAIAGLNLRGLSVSALGNRFAAYLAFDDPDAVTAAIQVLASMEG